MNLRLRAVLVLAATLALPGLVAAKPWWLRGADSNDNDFLDPDVAFRVAAQIDGNVLHVRWVIADGYYLYRQKMDIQAESPDLVVSQATFPRGTMKADPNLGPQEIFLQQVEGTASFTRSDAGAHPLQIKVTYQGCAEAGLCYPPITKVLFPWAAAVAAHTETHRWEGLAILGGWFAFLLAGLVLRKGRRLATPVS